MPGPVPKRADQRRRRNTPKQHESGVVSAGRASVAPRTIGFESPHPLIADLWKSLQGSVEAKFYSSADWRRVRMELWYANELMTGRKVCGAQAWTAVQSALNSLLVSPADKRRVGIELQAAKADEDADAAEATVTELHARFSGAG
jgi:hypothetical protein